MKNKTTGLCIAFMGAACLMGVVPVLVIAEADNELRVVKALEVGETFSGTRISATLLTHGEHQYVAYYNADQQVVIAERRLGSDEWFFRELPLNARWNNHVGIKGLAIDAKGYLHLSGNMHAMPLVYWRTTEPYDSPRLKAEGRHHIETLERIDRMVGEKEDRVTYENFRELPDGRLTFWYRYGRSGQGQRIINVWDAEEMGWQRLMDEPLFDGLGEVNVYPSGPIQGPDGNYHFIFMWRETPDARTNHQMSYVWSEDMVNWRTAAGDAVALPITRRTEGVVVDPLPPLKGMINMGTALGFDAENRPIVSYHKYDAEGNSQIYNARWEEDRWEIYQTSDWDWRWEFGGWGAIPSHVGAGSVRVTEDGFLSQPYRHEKEGSGVWKLDPETLKPAGVLPSRGWEKPGHLRQVDSDFRHADGSRMQVNWSGDLGGVEGGVEYALRWESLPVNRDRPRDGELPGPSVLMLYKFEKP